MLNAGRVSFEAASGVVCDPVWLEPPDFANEPLYGWRRDAEGVPSDQPAVRARPGQCETVGAFHLMLRQAGAAANTSGYELNGRSIRVINGAGAVLSQMKTRFVEAPTLAPTDMVVAAGATNLPLPGSVVRPGVTGSFMRPAPLGDWFDLADARVELGI